MDSVQLAFSGVVVTTLPAGQDEPGSWQVVKFDVARIWKGNASKEVTIYNRMTNPDNGSAGPIPFIHGHRYIVFAHRLSGAEMQELGLPTTTVAFGTGMCAGGSQLLEVYKDEVSEIGFGQAPK
jgi:hypothetical protein